MMDFPALMPSELNTYLKILNEDSLYSTLVKHPQELVLFFETAADDETWSENHQELLKKLLDWLTVQTFNSQLSKILYVKVAHAIQKHHLVLQPLLAKNILIKMKDGQENFNGLLLAAFSDFFKQILTSESHAKNKNILFLPQVSLNEFFPIASFMNTGFVPGLATKGEEEIIGLLKRAKVWELSALSEQCEHTLSKYLIEENVFDRLELSLKEGWPLYEQSCIQFINKKEWGFRLSSNSMENLAFEFLDFQEPTIDFFEQLRPLITAVICGGALVEQPQFGLVLNECPKLFGLDISRTQVFSNQFQEIPKALQALNVSECPWVSKDTLNRLLVICPDLTELFFKSNGQLNYIFWVELVKFKKLRKLDVSQCLQIQDSDLTLLLKGLSGLKEFSLGSCKRIEEKGFLSLAKSLPQLVRLDISQTSISDTALVEITSRCRYLTALNISSCMQLTEKGILAAIKSCVSLNELNMLRCSMSSITVQEIRRSFPQIALQV